MQGAGLLEGTDLSSVPADGPLKDVHTVVGLAVELDRLAAQADAVVARAAELLRDGPTDARPADSARELLVAAGRIHHAAQVACTLGLEQVDATNAHLDDCVRSAPRWAEQHAGLSPAAVNELQRLRRSVERYPLLAEAFVAGRARSMHLAAIDRIIPSHFRGEARDQAVQMLADCQPAILSAIESSLTPQDFSRFCGRVKDCVDTDGPQPETPGANDSEIRFRQAQRELRARKDDPELVGTPDDRTPEARQAAALLNLVDSGAASGRPGRVGLYLHIDLEDLAVRGAEMPPAKAHTEADYDITVDSLWGLLADADVTPIFHAGGTPLCFGRMSP